MRENRLFGLVPALTMATLTLLWGCQGKPPTEQTTTVPQTPAELRPGEEETLFPLTEGNQWSYELVYQQNFQEIGFRMTKVVPAGKGKRATIEVVDRFGQVLEKQDYLVNSKGIFQETSANSRFNPVQPIMPFPYKVGKRFTWAGEGPLPFSGAIGQSRLEGKVLGFQEVDTAIGRMNAIAIEVHQEWTHNGKRSNMDGIVWLAPKVGIVRQAQTGMLGDNPFEQMIRLKRKTLKE